MTLRNIASKLASPYRVPSPKDLELLKKSATKDGFNAQYSSKISEKNVAGVVALW